jgi:hypothetical protein
MYKRKQILSIIVVLFTVYSLFFTPHFVINNLIAIALGANNNLNLNYILPHNENPNVSYLMRYSFNHSLYDGALMSEIVSRSPLQYHTTIRTPRLYHDYQVIHCKNNTNNIFSSFTIACATICEKMLQHSSKHKWRVAVVVSKRHLLKNTNKTGNFLTYATYVVYKTDSFLDICKKHHEAVYKVKHNSEQYANLYSLLSSYFFVDVCFNSHRSLNTIKHNSGEHLYRITKSENFHNEHTLNSSLFNEKHCRFVILNMYRSQWYISDIYIV